MYARGGSRFIIGTHQFDAENGHPPIARVRLRDQVGVMIRKRDQVGVKVRLR